ncbi:hypothetical protein [Catenuloplanes atrovinosus]|uniref:Uncharacterized protein n=1 Tax=Catenuloplanes atrovinosus TaxID=137266 RepID=A0AAE3YRE8_9ACTN|nr:hypothetical protein [Catenuloplanes atrovinosus]MDR7277262.1 hypothetical protein [Catenuloplanes atrovinosus]
MLDSSARRRPVAVLLTLLVALAGAYLGGAAVNRAAWEFAPGLPSGAAANEITATLLPGLHVWGGGDADLFVSQSDGEGIEYGYATYWVRHTGPTRDIQAYTTDARDRLAAAGWRVHDYIYDPPEDLIDGGTASAARFWAERPGLVLGFEDFLFTERPAYDADGGIQITLRRDDPGWLAPVTWAGAILGGVLAGALAVWTRRRIAVVPGGSRIAATTTVFMLLLLLPGMLVQPVPEVPGKAPFWGGFMDLGEGPAVLAAVLAVPLLGVAVVIAFRAGPLWPLIRRVALAAGRRRWLVLATALVVVAVAALTWTAAAVPAARPEAAPSECRPAPGPPAQAPASETNGSTLARVYVDPASTPDERNLIAAAIRRSWAGVDGPLVWDPDSAEFRDVYCDGGVIPAEAVAGLPYFFEVELAVPTDYPALVQEVTGLRGVVTVRQERPRED